MRDRIYKIRRERNQIPIHLLCCCIKGKNTKQLTLKQWNWTHSSLPSIVLILRAIFLILRSENIKIAKCLWKY